MASNLPSNPASNDAWLSLLAASRGRRTALQCRRPGLLVIDVQRLFADPGSPAFLPAAPAALPAMRGLIGAFRAAGRPILFTRHAHEPDDRGGNLGHFFPRLLRRHDPWSALLPEIAALARPSEIWVKSRHACFGPILPSFLHGLDAVFLVGLQTPLCVLATALRLAAAELPPVVVADACVARDEVQHLAALRCLAAGHAHVWSSAEALAFLRGSGR